MTSITVRAIISLALSGKNERRTLVGLLYPSEIGSIISLVSCQTYLGLSKIVSRVLINCATIHRILRCGPYANKKSQRWSTSGRGGVQAQSVNTDGNA